MSEDRHTPHDSRPRRPARWRVLPARPRPEDLRTEHRDPAVPGSILAAADVQREFMIRHGS